MGAKGSVSPAGTAEPTRTGGAAVFLTRGSALLAPIHAKMASIAMGARGRSRALARRAGRARWASTGTGASGRIQARVSSARCAPMASGSRDAGARMRGRARLALLAALGSTR